MNEELNRAITWLDTWVEQHPETRAATRISVLLTAVKAMNVENRPAEEGVPVGETAAKYVYIKNEMLSRIPHGSLWERVLGDDARLDNYLLHLYHSHTLGCEECFGPHRV